jgi:hypothetical protein
VGVRAAIIGALSGRTTQTVRCAAILAVALLLVAPARADEPPPSAPTATTRLQGAATFERNRPVVGATVAVRPESRAGEVRLTTTDAKGNFRIDGLADGQYTVEFHREDLETVKKPGVSLRAPFRAIVEVKMRPRATPRSAPSAPRAEGVSAEARIEGKVLGPEGTPASDVRVRAVRSDAAVDPRETRTGADGTFALEGLIPGEWRLESLGLGYLPVRLDLQVAGPTRLELHLVRQAATHLPLPLDLLPHEEPIPPPDGS